jgi:hypothetical protein
MRELYPDLLAVDVAALIDRKVSQVYQKAMALGLRKSTEFNASDISARICAGQQNPAMIATRLKPGNVPWNKGKPGLTGVQEACRATQFKKGQMAGAAQKRWVKVGTLRINGEGLLDQKVTDLGLGPRDWEGVHRLVWKAVNGQIPAGHVITFKPGRKSTVLEKITADAVECISRAELAYRNHPRNSNPELGKLIQLKGAITRQVNRITKEHNERTQP